jgi:hypothetical protein
LNSSHPMARLVGKLFRVEVLCHPSHRKVVAKLAQ